MTFDDIWQQLLQKDTRLDEGNTELKMTAGNLKTLLQQTYCAGQKNGQHTQAKPFDFLTDLERLKNGRR